MKDKRMYNSTYKIGKTTVHVVAPHEMQADEVEEVLEEYHAAGWSIIEELLESCEELEKTSKGNQE